MRKIIVDDPVAGDLKAPRLDTLLVSNAINVLVKTKIRFMTQVRNDLFIGTLRANKGTQPGI